MPYLLPDGEPVRCSHTDADDPPKFWTDCENLADEKIEAVDAASFHKWVEDFPRTLIRFSSWALDGSVYLCSKHAKLWRSLTNA